MTTLRLLADDLTGALDTAAELVGLAGPIHAMWHGAVPSTLPPNVALDSGTRELEASAAVSVVASMAPSLGDADIAFKKIDSLMRGPTLAEIAACVRHGKWEQALLAPAFPYQGRVTRGGVQHACDGRGRWSPVGGDIVARLQQEGVQAQRGRFDAELPRGISVFDAETDEDLARIAALGRMTRASVLWVGTGGLARAIANGSPAQATTQLPSPLLGLFGSDQDVTAGQLAACGPDWTRIGEVGPAEVAALLAQLQTNGRVFVSIALPPGTARDEAAGRIGKELSRLAQDMPPPGTLVVAGGETLRGLCLSLGARSLELQGRIVPGLPRSIMRGGRWDGVTVISKSGAFGTPTLLRDLLRGTLTTERML
jgi:D-threonate/D-erythronate kinase